MKNRIWLAPRIAFARLVLVTLGCGGSSEAAATEAPTALPDMSVARISLAQMSGGFKEIPTDEIMKGVGTSVDREALPETVFAFVYPQKFQLVLGMTYLLEDKLERRVFEHERAT